MFHSTAIRVKLAVTEPDPSQGVLLVLKLVFTFVLFAPPVEETLNGVEKPAPAVGTVPSAALKSARTARGWLPEATVKPTAGLALVPFIHPMASMALEPSALVVLTFP